MLIILLLSLLFQSSLVFFYCLGPNELLNLWNSLYFNLVQNLCSSFLVILVSTIYFMFVSNHSLLIVFLLLLSWNIQDWSLKTNPKNVEFQSNEDSWTFWSWWRNMFTVFDLLYSGKTNHGIRGEPEVVIL